jgi:Papain-like cysteine protease AvrRpt2.
MHLEHEVPLIGQVTANLCWHAAFQMIESWYNRVLKTRRPAAFTANQYDFMRRLDWGVRPEAISRFAQMVGMTIIRKPADAAGLGELLLKYGPLWYPGTLPDGAGHVVVIRGIQNTEVLLNDPNPAGTGTRRKGFITHFFELLKPIDNQFLVMLANSSPDTNGTKRIFGFN